jgi:ubiquinol-cytochrome c reductase cytochrome b subunit
MLKLAPYLRSRIGWEAHLKPFVKKPLPGDLNWTFTMGGVCALLLLVEAVTGILLALYYNPSPEHAYQAIDYIMKDVFMGRILRGIHHWGAGAMVIVVLFHMATSFYYGAYKPPRELTWIMGVGLLILTLAFGFTGYLLPWDQKAYWATVVGTNIPSDIPLIGKFLTQMLRGGEEVSGLTLTRFYALHILVLPMLMVLCAVVHIYLIRIHDIAGHWDPEHPDKKRKSLFFPDHLFKNAVAFSIVFSGVIFLAVSMDPPREEIAMTPDPAYLPRPEWYYMWLFKLLTYFSGKAEIMGSLAIPLGIVLLLLFLPFLNRSELRSPADRPLAIAMGAMFSVGFVYLSLTGLADSKPYGDIVVVPNRELTRSEMRGAKVWVEKDCAYCHNIKGRGGRSEGPDLSNVIAKNRTKDWIVKFIRDPKSISRLNIMPKYDLTKKELNSLAEFILSLDFERYGLRTISKEEVIQDKIE